MVDTPHNEEKEALQQAIATAAVYRGVTLCLPQITRTGSWVTRGDATVIGPGYTVTCLPSKEVKALIDASLDPITPPPVDVPPADPAPVIDVPPTSPQDRTPPTFTAIDLHWRDKTAAERVDVEITLDDGTALAVSDADVGVTRMGDVLVLTRYADCVVIENPWPASTQNLAGNMKVTVDGAVVFDDRARFDLRTGTRPIRTGLAQFTPGDIRDQIGKLLANYADPGSFKDMMPKDDGKRYGINGRGPMTYDAMGTTGGRNEIGLIPGGDLAYAIRGEQWPLARLGADHARCYPIHMRDPATGLPLDPTQWPTASTLHAHLGYKYGPKGTNPVVADSASPLVPDTAHQPHYGIVPFLATGSDFDAEELLFWASYQGTWNNAAYRQYEKAIVSGSQTRGIAWGIASYGYAAKLLDGRHPQAASYRQALRNTADAYWIQRFAPGKPQNNIFGVFPEVAYRDTQGRYRGVAPWQNHFLASALNLLVQFGFAEFTAWRDYSAAFPVQLARSACYQAMSLYNWSVIDPDLYTSRSAAEAGTSQWYRTWDAALSDSLAHSAPGEVGKPCGQLSLSAPIGFVSDGRGPATSFAANLQPALAAAVDAGIEGAGEVWATFLKWRGPGGEIDYTTGAQFDIVPLHARA